MSLAGLERNHRGYGVPSSPRTAFLSPIIKPTREENPGFSDFNDIRNIVLLHSNESGKSHSNLWEMRSRRKLTCHI